MKSIITKLLLAYLIVMLGIFIYNVQTSVLYSIHGWKTYIIFTHEMYGIVKCDKLFKDNSCSGIWHTLGTRDNIKQYRSKQT